ncbi:hypothetical protein C41B8_05568 [Salinisphaera hydrothermalis C41B8]|uniref:Uncharacterized protein n=1 Tax=Salinisphaera hydrothermalis (strain C41B8) TaxID=1304275 RepID=A0A084INR1_SALHC|nr:hypothetical protein C41B8_05568 [Salinisphaera hydrothermalis C41B8]
MATAATDPDALEPEDAIDLSRLDTAEDLLDAALTHATSTGQTCHAWKYIVPICVCLVRKRKRHQFLGAAIWVVIEDESSHLGAHVVLLLATVFRRPGLNALNNRRALLGIAIGQNR